MNIDINKLSCTILYVYIIWFSSTERRMWSQAREAEEPTGHWVSSVTCQCQCWLLVLKNIMHDQFTRIIFIIRNTLTKTEGNLFWASNFSNETEILSHCVWLDRLVRKWKVCVFVFKRLFTDKWALSTGYHGLKSSGDDCLLEDSIDSIRKEVER